MGLASYKEAGIEAHGYVCDVTDEAQVKEMVAKISEEVGVIDILVNNAAIIMRKPMLEMGADEFRKVIDVDLNAPFILSIQNRTFVFPYGSRFPNAGSRDSSPHFASPRHEVFAEPFSKGSRFLFVYPFYCTPFGKRWQETAYSFACAAIARFWRSSS